MIFATVGTHEDPFNRLVVELDRLAAAGVVREEVRIQSGYSTAAAPRCTMEKMMAFDAVQAAMAGARIVITHGGPASIMQALSHGKVPIVVPRDPAHGEHVDGHQIQFARRLADRVLVVEDIRELEGAITGYDQRVARLPSPEPPRLRAERFAHRLGELCGRLVAPIPPAGRSGAGRS